MKTDLGELHSGMNYKIKLLKDESDWKAITEIYNFYAVTDYSVYTFEPVDENYFIRSRTGYENYPVYVLKHDSQIVGFGFLSPYSVASTMKKSAILSYFIYHEHTGKGQGTKLMELLIKDGISIGVNNFLVHISSKNKDSINFHKKNGFVECGRFKNMGEKFNNKFDIIWMQKIHKN